MTRIERLTVFQVHDTTPRQRSKCDDCGKRRLTTQVTLRTAARQTVIKFLCNDCLTRTPSWP